MKLKKLANHFTTKIAIATNGNLISLLKIFNTLNSLQLTRQLWNTAAGGDPYVESDLESIFTNLSSLTRNLQSKLKEQGLSQSDVAGFLTKTSALLDSFANAELKTHLDPSASDKLRDAKSAVSQAISSYVPVALPSQDKSKPVPLNVGNKPAPSEVSNETFNQPLTDDVAPGEFSTNVGPMLGPDGEDWSGY